MPREFHESGPCQSSQFESSNGQWIHYRSTGHLSIALMTLALAVVFPRFSAAQDQIERYPAGTKIMARINQDLSSKSVILGQAWDGTLVNAIPVGDRVVAQTGAAVDGIVTEVKRGGSLHGKGSVSLMLLHANGVPVSSDIITRDGNGHLKSNTQKIGGGAAAGAGLGGLFGGGTGALVGAAAGATAGTVAAAKTSKHDTEVPTESVITFTVQ